VLLALRRKRPEKRSGDCFDAFQYVPSDWK
jgi:hypothetical protein